MPIWAILKCTKNVTMLWPQKMLVCRENHNQRTESKEKLTLGRYVKTKCAWVRSSKKKVRSNLESILHTWSIKATVLLATMGINFLSTCWRTLALSKQFLSKERGINESPARCKMPEAISSIASWFLGWSNLLPLCVMEILCYKIHNWNSAHYDT